MTIGRACPSDWIKDSNSASRSPSIRPLSVKTVSPLDDLRTLNIGFLFRRRSTYYQSETSEQSRAEFPLRNGIARRQPHVTLRKQNEWRNWAVPNLTTWRSSTRVLGRAGVRRRAGGQDP